MTSIVVNEAVPFGALSNDVARLALRLNQEVSRLAAAEAAASSGYNGTAGTQFETGTNFGVAPGATPGVQGTAWRFQVDSFAANWATFWNANKDFITALDNGGTLGS